MLSKKFLETEIAKSVAVIKTIDQNFKGLEDNKKMHEIIKAAFEEKLSKLK